MKLICVDTGKKSEIKKNEFGELDIKAAADRTIARTWPGHFAVRAAGWNGLPHDGFTVEVCRAVGGMTEHVGRVTLEILKDPAAATLGRKGGQAKSEAKAAASRENGRRGGRPRGLELTPLQQEILDLRRSGLKIKEIARQTGRNPENIRQILARAARHLGIEGGWAEIQAEGPKED